MYGGGGGVGVACDNLLMKMVSNIVCVFLLLEYIWALNLCDYELGFRQTLIHPHLYLSFID